MLNVDRGFRGESSPVISISPSHRVSFCLNSHVSVYITAEKYAISGLTEANIRRISSNARRKARSGTAIFGSAPISPQTHAHSSQYFTALRNLTP
jgi:hypothetical protein